MVADDNAQDLFDNCFKIAEGPDAPDITFQELDNELLLYLTNRKISNNYKEGYNQKNPFIAIPDTLDGVPYLSDDDKDTLKFYTFQGYLIYQVKNGLVTVGELEDPSKARLLAQVDIKDGVTQLINYTFDENLQANVPKEMVNGADKGIKHSFRITTDLFSTAESNRLVNHKTYYYMAIAYGYNEYKHYDPLDPLALDGQVQPYIGSRKMAGGRGITSFSAIPHNPAPENGGTIANSEYGDMPQITRIEGQGNGGNDLDFTAESEAYIVAHNAMDNPVYRSGYGPIQVKVIDPLNVREGLYKVQFKDTTSTSDLADAFWTLHLPFELEGGIDSINSDQTIAVENEQIFLDLGISVTIKQVADPGVNVDLGNGVIGSRIEFEDPTLVWLGGFSDREGQMDANWIRSGTASYDVGTDLSAFDDHIVNGDFVDPNQDFEGFLDGTWSPYRMVSFVKSSVLDEPAMHDAVGSGLLSGNSVKTSDIKLIPSVDIVFTADKSKWSRCIVLEARNDVVLAQGGAKHLELRKSNSVDKYGNDDGSGTQGLGWFPGYAINVETGERLNMAFAEDSWLAGDNGKDMIWNPTSTVEAGIPDYPGGPLPLVMGGKHYVYVFRDGTYGSAGTLPTYDECAAIYAIFSGSDPSGVKKMFTFKSCVWAGVPMLEAGHSLLETTARVKLRVDKPYNVYVTDSSNVGLPLYSFDMTGFEADTGNASAMDSALAMINVVPNPYYAYSEYENHTLDRRIKITNLPEDCTISIYNVNGTLMRRFVKGDPKTSLEWDLTNSVDIPVASGVYLIHIMVPNVGERTLKWFGIMKPTDLNGIN